MSRIRTAIQREALAADQARMVADALVGANVNAPTTPRAAAGDPRRLRGIPITARGVGGTMPGTHPESVIR